MLNLSDSLGRTRGANAPKPLPTVYEKLAEHGVYFRRGQMSMIAGAAGGGKTLMAQWLAIKSGVPCLYFSADTDETTMAERGAAMLTGEPQEDIRVAEQEHLDHLAEVLWRGTSKISWDYESDHTQESIDDAVSAFGLVYGQWPALIIFDVLLSYQPGAGDWSAMNDFILYCKSIASKTNAHVLLLHHTSGAYTDKTEAPPRSAIMNKVDQLPSLILTIGRNENVWNICVAKNRNGKSDPRAESPIQYGIDMSRCLVSEPRGFYG